MIRTKIRHTSITPKSQKELFKEKCNKARKNSEKVNNKKG